MVKIVQRRHTPCKRDNEIVGGGFEGYRKLARGTAWKRFRFGFDSPEDLEQSAALAALVALRLVGADGTLREVHQVIRHVLNDQVKASTWRMINYYKSNGKRSAYWGRREVLVDSDGQALDQPRRPESVSEPCMRRRVHPQYVGVGQWYRKATTPIDELLFGS